MIDLEVGPLDLHAITQALTNGPRTNPQLVDMPQSIRLARAALAAGGTLESDISIAWRRDGSPIAYSPMCLRRSASGSLELQGMPDPIRLPTILVESNEQTRRTILHSFESHLAEELARTGTKAAHVWVPCCGEMQRGSIRAWWLSSVPTIGAGFGLNVDLSRGNGHAWSGLRKSYRSLINRGIRELQTTIVTREATDDEVSHSIDELAQLHASAAGRRVYGSMFWSVAEELVREGLAACVLTHRDTEVVGGLLLLLDQPRSSYALAAYDRPLMAQGLPIGHTALWSAIRWLGEQGFKSLSLGTAPTPPPPAGKEAGIDLFKRGFATALAPQVVTAFQGAR